MASQGKSDYDDEDKNEMPRRVLLSCFDIACNDGVLVTAVLETVIQTHCPIGHSPHTVVAMDTFRSLAFQTSGQLLAQQHRAKAVCQSLGVSWLKQNTA